ncbi:MAG: FecR domain-containing protein, partial [Bacteroidota bacterium]
PFVVMTQLGTVRVLGTEFNVRYRGEQLEVAVLKGSVRVISGSADSDHAVVLWEGEGTRFSRGAAPEEPAPLRFTGYPGWLHGKLFFDRATLAEVCKEIEDYFDVVVIIERQTGDPATITGSIDATTPDAAVITIARLTGARYRYDQSRYTLY